MGERVLDDERRIERRLELPLMIAAALVVPAIVIEQSSPSHGWAAAATALNITTWGVFLAEAVIMMYVAASPLRWLRDHPLEVAIVVLTPPFLPAALQAARVFRLLRLLRLIKLAAIARRLMSTEGVRDAGVLALLTVLGGGAAFSAIEKPPAGWGADHYTSWDGVWWAMQTVTTVGYGDITPRTTAGRLIAFVVMVVGIGFVAIITAAAASRFLREQRKEAGELERIEAQLGEVLARLDAMESGSEH